MRRAFGDHGAMVLDASGAVVLAEPGLDSTVGPALGEAVRQAIDSGEVQHARRLTAGRGTDVQWFDVVAPLVGAGLPAHAAIVLRIDPQTFLLPTLEAAPTARGAGRTLLVHADGDRLTGLFGRRSSPMNTPGLLAARFVQASSPWAMSAKASASTAARCSAPCAGCRGPTGTWWRSSTAPSCAPIVSSRRVDPGRRRHRPAGPVHHRPPAPRAARPRAGAPRAGRTGRAAALARAGAVDRRGLERRHLREGSGGRYLLCNAAASRFIGRPGAEVLGRDDRPGSRPSTPPR